MYWFHQECFYKCFEFMTGNSPPKGDVEAGEHFSQKKQGGPVGSVEPSWTRGSHGTSGYLHHKVFCSSGMLLLLCFLLFWFGFFFWGIPWQVLIHPYFHPNSNRGNLWSLKTFIWQKNGFLCSCERHHCKVRKIVKC